MLYKTKNQTALKVDAILHAPSYYGMLNGCVDIGNYEAVFQYFPVNFNESMTPLSLRYHIEGASALLGLSTYPEPVEILGWELQPAEQTKLQSFYDMSFSNDKLTLWRRR